MTTAQMEYVFSQTFRQFIFNMNINYIISTVLPVTQYNKKTKNTTM